MHPRHVWVNVFIRNNFVFAIYSSDFANTHIIAATIFTVDVHLCLVGRLCAVGVFNLSLRHVELCSLLFWLNFLFLDTTESVTSYYNIYEVVRIAHFLNRIVVRQLHGPAKNISSRDQGPVDTSTSDTTPVAYREAGATATPDAIRTIQNVVISPYSSCRLLIRNVAPWARLEICLFPRSPVSIRHDVS